MLATSSAQKNALNRGAIFIYYAPWGISFKMDGTSIKDTPVLTGCKEIANKNAALSSIKRAVKAQLHAQISHQNCKLSVQTFAFFAKSQGKSCLDCHSLLLPETT